MFRTCLVPVFALAILVFSDALFAQPQNPPRDLRDKIEVQRDIEYARVGDKSLKLDVYVPKDAKGPLPCVVWVHGGAWRAGNKNGPQVAYLNEHGYVVASIQYRLSQEAIFPAQIHDCKGAIRFLRANAEKYRIDAKRIGVAGASAGGHLVALLGTSGDVKELEGDVGGNSGQSSRVQAVVDLFGPVDFTLMNKQAPADSRIDHDAPNAPEALLIGGPVQENKDKAAKASPLTYITKDDPPFLILHGDKDNVVPHGQSVLLEAALKKAQVPAKLHTVQGAGHGWRRTRELDEMVRKFFDEHLKK